MSISNIMSGEIVRRKLPKEEFVKAKGLIEYEEGEDLSNTEFMEKTLEILEEHYGEDNYEY